MHQDWNPFLKVQVMFGMKLSFSLVGISFLSRIYLGYSASRQVIHLVGFIIFIGTPHFSLIIGTT